MMAGSAMSGLIGGADMAVRGALTGVTGIVTKPLEGLQDKGVAGFASGLASGLVGAVRDPVTGVLKMTSNVVSGTVQSATEVVGGTILCLFCTILHHLYPLLHCFYPVFVLKMMYLLTCQVRSLA